MTRDAEVTLLRLPRGRVVALRGDTMYLHSHTADFDPEKPYRLPMYRVRSLDDEMSLLFEAY